ncbi:MAG: OsmC family protein [Cytophagales bacterium]|nr:OsmC family protein [Cytophagales bacterium]
METSEVLTATATIGTDLYRTELTARTHTLLGDEPPEAGGTDLGPRPGDFMRMSLASCTAITLRMYANRKGWDVARITVSVSSGPFDGKTTYTTAVEIKGSLTEEQEKRMLQIAKLCPVHKTLTHPIEIHTELSISK